ncbi:MAG: PA2169 family four-helix-bundle protein [Clostridium sp.]|nr:PA2169 family four-helix-bundle protein [Clostridium sp.]
MTDKTGHDGDTVKLLRECDSGIKMGISSINDVIDNVKSTEFKSLLQDCRNQHEKLQQEIDVLLDKHNDDGKDPNVMAKGMSWMKTNMKIAMDDTDNTVADLITDGCNMGAKSLSRYLNQYSSADSRSRDITSRLVSIEDNLTADIRPFL